MSNLIEFLENVGKNAQLRYAGSGEMEQALDRAGIAPELRAALLGDNRPGLETLLGVKAAVCCLIRPSEDEDQARGGRQETFTSYS